MKRLLTALLIVGCSLGFVACKKNEKMIELQVPTELVVEHQYISFKEVDNASYYNIYYNGNTWTVQPTYQGEIVLDASKIFTELKTYEVKVKAIGTGKYLDSKYSESYFYEKTESLGIPEIKLNQDTVTWTLIDNAINYTLEVTYPNPSIPKGYYIYTDTSNTFDIKTILTDVGTYSFRVKAGTNEENPYSSKVSYAYTKKLSTPSEVSLDFDKSASELYLYLIADENSVSYMINVNGEDYELKDNAVNQFVSNNGYSNYKKIKLLSFLKTKDASFKDVKDFNVSIQAKAPSSTNYINSEVSNKVSLSVVNVLSAPVANLTGTSPQATLSWNEVSDAKSYSIYKNYEFFTNVNSDTTSLFFNKSDLENQIITIQAVGVDGKHTSPMSTPQCLSELDIVSVNYTLDGTLLTFEEDTELDKCFIEMYNEEVYKTLSLEEDFSEIDLQNYLDYGNYKVTISCYKNGYSSKVETKNLNYTKKLATPNIKNLGDQNSMYILELNKVAGAIGYEIKVNNVKLSKLYTSTIIDLTNNISDSGEYKITVRAIGDATKNITSSDEVEQVVVHKRKLDAPAPSVEFVNDSYILKFNQITGAKNYTILINNIPFGQNVSYSSEGYDISSYLVTAQEYTILVKAHPVNSQVAESEYGLTTTKKYIQLDVINADAMEINNMEGKYWLKFSTQTNAASYSVRIVHVESEQEYKIMEIKTVPFEISEYVQAGGTYKIYVTAVANTDNEYLYLSSAESGNPLVYIKDRPTLDMVDNLTVGNKTMGKNTIIASWGEVAHADKYYLTVTYTNNADTNATARFIAELYTTDIEFNLAEYLSKEGQYTIKIKAISDGKYESTAFSSLTYNYNITNVEDFKRNTVIYNGKTYSHYVENYEQLKGLLQYYYLYNNINYHDTNANADYNLKIMLASNVSIDSLNVECEAQNSGFTNNVTDGVTEVARMKKLAETALSGYSERTFYDNMNTFAEPTFINNTNYSYYLFNYKTGLGEDKYVLNHTGNELFESAYSTIAVQLRRKENYVYKLELNDKIDVTTTDQLFMAVQAGYAPNFVGSSNTAKSVYNSAKAVLNTICTDEMSDYQKVVAIYTWIVSNVNYNYDFDSNAMKLSNTLGSLYSDGDTSVKVGDAVYSYLESVFLTADHIAGSNAISKAFVLMCALEGIESIKVNGQKGSNTYYYWNKVCIDCSPYDEDNSKSWYAIDICSSYYSGISLRDGAGGEEIFYNVGSYQYFLVKDSVISSRGIVEKYALKTVSCDKEFNYYGSTSYSYEKTVQEVVNGQLQNNTYSGSGTLKYSKDITIKDYLTDVISSMVCNAKNGNKYWLEIDISSADNAGRNQLISDINTKYSADLPFKIKFSIVSALSNDNNKVLIIISNVGVNT